MKTFYSVCYLLLLTQFSFSNSSFCPDPPSNDDPCINDDRPPIDLTIIGTHNGTTCCATEDFENIDCSDATNASVWYMYSPNSADEGYNITVVPGIDAVEGPMTVEVYSGLSDQGCNIGFGQTIAFSCTDTQVNFKIGNCFDADEVIFIKVSTNDADENCGEFELTIVPASCGQGADNCIDLTGQAPIKPITEDDFAINYICVEGCLSYACPEEDSEGGCPNFLQMPTVWFKVEVDSLAAQMFTTVESNGNWDPIWSVYSGPDCDNYNVVNFGGTPPCSNGDNTPELHQTSVYNEEENYWIAVTVDQNSLTSEGLGDGIFELCVATSVNGIICLGELEGGSCDDESLFMEITDRDNTELPLDGPFCQGEEVTINISFFYDASETGADWLIGFVPKFGEGWDLTEFDFEANAPQGNGQSAQWYEEGSDLAPIIQEPVPILCTYRDDDGILQLCNQLCESCTECEQQGMLEGDPLPSGYFWVTNSGNAGCDNDGSPGEGWGIGSTQAQIEWTFTLRVKVFDGLDECMVNNDLSISFQTFSDGVAGCWEDPVGECLLDRAMVSPPWRIGCSEVPPAILAENIEICTKSFADITVNTSDGSPLTVVVDAIENPFVTGMNDYMFEDGFGEISDFLVNTNIVDEIVTYEVYAVDSTLVCLGPKTVIEVLVYTQYIDSLPEFVCTCIDGCSTIGVDSVIGSTYIWDTGETTSSINVCPAAPTLFALTVTDSNGCEQFGSVLVDCEGLIEECQEPEYFKLIYDFFVDINANGSRDSLENSFGEGSFFLEPDHTLYYNTSVGEDTILLEGGEYSLVYSPFNLECWMVTTDSIVPVILDSAQNCQKVEFGLAPTEPKRDIALSHFLVTRCNSDRFFHIIAENDGTQIESGILWTILDEDMLPNDFPTNATIDTFIAPNIVGWYFEGLLPGDKISKTVKVSIPGPPNFPIGGVLTQTIYAELDNEDGTTEIWDEKNVHGSVQCGYDPNDKAVDPSHEDGYTNIEQDELIYKIRFQNTGNSHAENIQIKDTLSEFLDISSVQYIIGSHDDNLSFSRVGERILIFNFDNINLPDSTADFEGSQGFLLYKVSIIDDLPEGTLIENTANIYFDNNPVVVTNTTESILYQDLDVDGFFSIEDCDEENADINPDAEEIPNNDIDEDCDGVALIIDNDMDGFNSDEDCDDENPDINPDAEEIINNTVDENCDDLVVIIDKDMDGFNSDEDCDDENADINPDAEEIANNEIDEDCDGEALIIDVDMDGFNSDEDCNDDNPDINPDAVEIANNEIDEDCDGEVLIIDIDMDGFNSDEDCNDEDPDINPDAVDIPENGIDEDCDGMDAIISGIEEQQLYTVSINPNPSNDAFNIILSTTDDMNYIIRDMVGREVARGKITPFSKTVYLGDEPNGVYLIVLNNLKLNHSTFHKLLKI